MPDSDCLQRLTRLEVNQAEIFKDYQEHSNREDRFHKEHDENQKNQTQMLMDIKMEQARMRSFWGGMVFTITALGAGAAFVINYMFGKG